MNEPTDVLDAEPVFVDPTGRRQRIARNVGIVVGCLLAAYLVIVAFGVVTGSRVPLTPWPAVRPTAGTAPPGHGDSVLRQVPARATPAGRTTTQRRTAAPASGTAPTTRATAPATSPTSPTSASASPTPTHSGRGRAYGITKSPHPKKS